MRRRLDLALALIHEPQVLFLDEPTTGLDPNSRAALWDEVRKLNREPGTTVFLTTQYMEEADQLAGRIAIIDGGKIIAEGTPAQLKAKVGEPTLRISLASGEDRSMPNRSFWISANPRRTRRATSPSAAGGAGQVASVSRALDEAGIQVEGLELHNPTLDDVFQRATGRRFEGAEERAPEESPSPVQ